MKKKLFKDSLLGFNREIKKKRDILLLLDNAVNSLVLSNVKAQYISPNMISVHPSL